MSSGLQKEREIVLPPIFVSGTQVRLMSRVCLWYRLFKMKDEGLWRGSSHSLSLIYTHKHQHTHSECPSFVNSQGYFICTKIFDSYGDIKLSRKKKNNNRNNFWSRWKGDSWSLAHTQRLFKSWPVKKIWKTTRMIVLITCRVQRPTEHTTTDSVYIWRC